MILRLILLLAVCALAHANEPNGHFKIGLAAVSSESIYLGGENQSRAFPAVDFKHKRFYFQAGDVGFELFEHDNWSFDIGLGANLAGDVDRGDSELLTHLPDLSFPISGFVSAGYKSKIGLFTLKHSREINNKHDGHSSSLSYAAPIRRNDWLFLPRLSFQRHSAEVVNYFYGVNPDLATSAIPAYQADAVDNWQLSLLSIYTINDKWSVLGNLQSEFYGNEISNSPIVEDDQRLSVFAGFLYQIY